MRSLNTENKGLYNNKDNKLFISFSMLILFQKYSFSLKLINNCKPLYFRYERWIKHSDISQNDTYWKLLNHTLKQIRLKRVKV